MSRGHIEYKRAAVPVVEPLLISGEALGLLGVVLSRDDDSGASTSLVEAAPFWRADLSGGFNADIEILVLSGAMDLAGLGVEQGDYLFIPACTEIGDWSTANGAKFLWMPTGELKRSAGGQASQSVLIRHTRRMQWAPPPSFKGRTVEETVTGLGVKFLREVNGGPYTLLTRHVPGWADPRLESHDTWEELLLLEGDYLMGRTGAIDAGAYIFRPGERPHGPQATRSGAVWFCRGERRIDFRFSEQPWVTRNLGLYLKTLPPISRPAPWGIWF